MNQLPNLISISGQLGSGKDLVANIIRGHFTKYVWVEDELVQIGDTFEIRRFSGKLKEIAGILLNCPAEAFENREFKESYLPEYDMTVRQFLQKTGESFRNNVHPDIWVNGLFREIEDIKELPEKRQDKVRLRELKNELAVVFGGRHLDVFYEMIVETGRYAKAIETGILGPFFAEDRARPVIIREISPQKPTNASKKPYGALSGVLTRI